MRDQFMGQLKELHENMIQMGNLCEEAISAAAASLMERNPEQRNKAYQSDEQIDALERKIENLCLQLLLQQQPVAKDLRVISSALKMISDMERIGDQAADIAELAKYVADSKLPSKEHLQKMAKEAVQMVNESISAFVENDLEKARRVIEQDDQVDELFNQVKKELIGLIAADADSGELWLDLIMVAKYLERIGDHATNVAEWVEYGITGVHPSGD